MSNYNNDRLIELENRNAELVEALRGMLAKAEQIYGILYYAEPHMHRTDAAFVAARAAISKATE